jgi:hypothetical protein
MTKKWPLLSGYMSYLLILASVVLSCEDNPDVAVADVMLKAWYVRKLSGVLQWNFGP